MAFRPGQFNMLTAFGVGEAAISVSSAPRSSGPLEHTVRDVGAGEPRLVRRPASATWSEYGVRSEPTGAPRGTAMPPRRHGDVVVVAGGIGLAPLRGAVHELVALRHEGGGTGFRDRRGPRALARSSSAMISTCGPGRAPTVAVTVDVPARGGRATSAS